MRGHAHERSEKKLTVRQPNKAGLPRSENAAVGHIFTALGIVPKDDAFFWTSSPFLDKLQGFNCPHMHHGGGPHSLLACDRPRWRYFGVTVFLVSKPEGVISNLPEENILLSRAVRQGYIILQSGVNKLALSSISDFV